ncbi:MAG: hypothetical protein JWM20_982 [Patescibacteria group bacterium]|nr:hypothetical protein [Patescibacteria group bacterium]
MFQFKTRVYNDRAAGTLEHDILTITGLTEKATIKEETKIADLFCEGIWNAIKEAKEKNADAFPVYWITLPILDGKPLVEQSIIFEPGHQMHILVD